MTFFNIFSNKKTKKEFPEIIADNREKNSLVISELINQNNKVKFEQLDIADYLINNIAIERKTKSDLANSIINKRIFSQIENLKKYKEYLLIIEEDNSQINMHENAIKGFILSTAIKSRIPVIFSNNSRETAKYLGIIARKKEKEVSLRQSRRPISKKEQIQFILEGFPNIGPIKAKALINKFKTIKNIANANKEELENILGKQSEEFHSLINQEP